MPDNTLEYWRENSERAKKGGRFLGDISLLLVLILLVATVVVFMNHPIQSIDPRVPFYKFVDEVLNWINLIGLLIGIVSACLASKRGALACFLHLVLLILTPAYGYV